MQQGFSVAVLEHIFSVVVMKYGFSVVELKHIISVAVLKEGFGFAVESRAPLLQCYKRAPVCPINDCCCV